MIGLCKLGLFDEALGSLKHYLREQQQQQQQQQQQHETHRDIRVSEMHDNEIRSSESSEMHDSGEPISNYSSTGEPNNIRTSSIPSSGFIADHPVTTPPSSVSSTTSSMVVSDHAWLSLLRGALARGYVEVALEVSREEG